MKKVDLTQAFTWCRKRKSRSKQKTSLEAQSLVKNLVCIKINIKASPKSTCLLQIENHNARHVYKITMQKSKYHTNAQTLKISYTNINLKYHKAETKIKPSPFEKEYFFTKALNGHRKQLTYSSREIFYLATLLFWLGTFQFFLISKIHFSFIIGLISIFSCHMGRVRKISL